MVGISCFVIRFHLHVIDHSCTAPSGAPNVVNVSSIGNNSVHVRWSPPAGGPVRGYRVFYTEGSITNTLTVSNALTTATVVHDLTLGVQYSITVQAFADFPSPNSTAYDIMLNGETGYIVNNGYCILNFVIFPAPSKPQNVTVTAVSSSSLVVQWSFPGNGVDGYEVSYSPVEGESCDSVPGGAVTVEGATTFTRTLDNLQAYTEYSITVRARGADGLGPPSTARRQRTAADGELEEMLATCI